VLKGRFRAAGGRLRQTLVVFQFAASIILIVSTLVVYNQLDFLRNQQLGFDIEQVVVLPIKDNTLRNQVETAKTALNTNPHVISTAAVSNLPGGSFNQNPIRWRDEEETEMMAELRVDFDALATLGVKLAEGRAFSRDFPSDSGSTFVLNEAAARLFDWPTPVGEQLTWFDDGELRKGEVIGVVEDFHFASLHQEVQPLIIQVLPQEVNYLLVRIHPEQAATTLAFLEGQWAQFQSAHPFEYSFLDQDFDALYQSEERVGALFMSFAVLAVFIACLGLFGLAAFTTEQRTKEIGVRKVMGASISHIAVLLSSDFVRLVGLAFLLAAPLAYLAAQRWLDGFAYRIDLSWPIFLMAGSLALAIALATVSYHAIRAALADPVKSLRYE
jgi:putative ABC transport system permease protein